MGVVGQVALWVDKGNYRGFYIRWVARPTSLKMRETTLLRLSTLSPARFCFNLFEPVTPFVRINDPVFQKRLSLGHGISGDIMTVKQFYHPPRRAFRMIDVMRSSSIM